MTEHNQVQELVARLERLERRDRWTKSGALVFLLAFVCLGLMAQTQTQTKKKSTTKAAAPAPAAPAAPTGPTAIEAQSFILKDDNGKVRAELSMSGTGPALKLKDQSGATLVTLSVNDSQPGGPFLLLSDPEHHASLNMSVLQGGGSQLALMGERPDIQVRLGVAPAGSTLELTDKDGYGTTIGNGVQTAKNGKVKNTTGASVSIFDKDRKTTWSTP